MALVAVGATKTPGPEETDRARIAEAFRLAGRLGDRLWDGWSDVPFAVLLVTDDREFLVGHPSPSEEFRAVGFDDLLAAEVLARPRTYDAAFLATFPAVPGSPVPAVVVGRAEATRAGSSTPWVVTLLHEHFHQLQMSRPGYFEQVEALDLSGGDTSGMWMLNFPFPYDSPEVQEAFGALCARLGEALDARGRPRFADSVRGYLAARRAFRERLDADDYRYFAFQVWQEGIARYTEARVGRWAASDYRPSARFRQLEDFTPFPDVARGIEAGLRAGLTEPALGEARRAAFYPVGGAEGLVLDAWNPGWRSRYFSEPFDTGRYFDTALAGGR